MVPNIEIGRRIKARREELNLTQRDLAVRLRIFDNAVEQWESGQRVLSVEDVQEAAHALDVPISYFLLEHPASVPFDRSSPFEAIVNELRIARLHGRLTDESAEEIRRFIQFRMGQEIASQSVVPPSEPDIPLPPLGRTQQIPSYRAPAITVMPEWTQAPRPTRVPLGRGDKITIALTGLAVIAVIAGWITALHRQHSAVPHPITQGESSMEAVDTKNPAAGGDPIPASADPLKNGTAIDLEPSQATASRKFGFIVVTGHVRNDGNQSATGVQVESVFFDGEGRTVTTSYGVLSNDPLPPGAETTYDVFIKDQPQITKTRTNFNLVTGLESTVSRDSVAPPSGPGITQVQSSPGARIATGAPIHRHRLRHRWHPQSQASDHREPTTDEKRRAPIAYPRHREGLESHIASHREHRRRHVPTPVNPA